MVHWFEPSRDVHHPPRLSLPNNLLVQSTLHRDANLNVSAVNAHQRAPFILWTPGVL